MVEMCFDEMNRVLTTLRQLINPAPFLMGTSPSLADCAFAQTLMLAQMMWLELDSPLPIGDELENWQQTMNSLKSVTSVLEPAREATEKWLGGKRLSA